MAEIQTRCPGQDGRSLTAEELPCPQCGYAVEFFSDEHTRTCPSCGTRVGRVPTNNCADWCSAAATCALLRGGPTHLEGDEGPDGDS